MKDFGEIALGERNITAFGYDSCGTSLLPIGSIVISTRAPIGKINITTGVLCTNQGCKSLVGNKWNKYFYYLLYVLKDQLTFLGRGTTFLELSTSALANFKIIIRLLGLHTVWHRYTTKKTKLYLIPFAL